MKILFLTTAFNGMAQRAWIELDRLDHQVKVQIADNAEAMINAVKEYKPELIIAPFLKNKIPETIWKNNVCLVVHPGIKGDRGASSLDWAILNKKENWGVTILQAAEKMDAGDIWASHNFKMRKTSKSCIYRHEVTQAAIKGLLEAVHNFQDSNYKPEILDYNKPEIKGTWRRSTCPSDFQFSWNENPANILNKINAADSEPGVLIKLFNEKYFAYGGHLEDTSAVSTSSANSTLPGDILAKRNKAICIAAKDKAIWLTHLKQNIKGAIKLPATIALGKLADNIPTDNLSPFENINGATFQEIKYKEEKGIGYIHFDFYNGAMDADQCRRLRETIIEAKKRPIKIIVLMGGEDIWSNGIHLNVIENAENPADESWANINAIDDLILEIINSPKHYIICAMQGNAGAGGVPFALSGDKVLARNGIVLNPHTKNMGLYGSEYWTYLLPKRIGTEKANDFTEQCLPWGTAIAKEIGLIDDVFGETAAEFREILKKKAEEIAALPYFDKLLMAKRFQRKKDERVKPLAKYREEELKLMWKNFYENNEGFNEKRFRFVHKIFVPETGQLMEARDWYSSRRKIYRRRKWEAVEYGN